MTEDHMGHERWWRERYELEAERDRYRKAIEAILAATDITGDGFDDADNALTDIYEIAAKALKEEDDVDTNPRR